MKLKEVLKAREPLNRLMNKNFTSYKVLRELVKLQKAVGAEVEFYTAQEKKNIELYSEKDDKGNPVILAEGRIKLKDTQAKADFDGEIAKLYETDIDGITAVVIRESDFKSSDDYPTPGDMSALDGFVEFAD